ncbi:hypothetical protein ACFVAV_20265 [Nocardia sp. NPDC057663]|uniref:hypothetical protein n=1 Tax=Nocardia sp. NPDC057663 TaxID=3346201 RepID=UPI0036716F02
MTRWSFLHFEDWALYLDEHPDITTRVCAHLGTDEPVQVVTPSSGVDFNVNTIIDWISERVHHPRCHARPDRDPARTQTTS